MKQPYHNPSLFSFCSASFAINCCIVCHRQLSGSVSVVFIQGDVSRGAVSMSTERGVGSAPMRQCNISLPDGSCCSVPLRAGVSIRDLLLGLCEKLCINLAAIDLFLIGGEKVFQII